MKYTFHLLGLGHLPQSRHYMSCAYTQKNIKLSKMLLNLGHEVIFYGAEGSDVECSKFVQTHTLKDICEDYGDGDNRFEIGYIGKILDQKKNMFYVFSGRDCIECDAEPTLYLISTKQNSNPCEYPYPGTEKYYMTGEIIYKSRAFWGEILNNVYGIVIYQIFYDNKIETERNCYLVSIENGKVNETKFNDYNAKLKQTQTLQKKGLCKEIQGKEYTTSP